MVAFACVMQTLGLLLLRGNPCTVLHLTWRPTISSWRLAPARCPGLLMLSGILAACDPRAAAPTERDTSSRQVSGRTGEPCVPDVPLPAAVGAPVTNRVFLRSRQLARPSGEECLSVSGVLNLAAPVPWIVPAARFGEGSTLSGTIVMPDGLFPPTGASAGGHSVTRSSEPPPDDAVALGDDRAFAAFPAAVRGLITKAAAEACELEDDVPVIQQYLCTRRVRGIFTDEVVSLTARIDSVFPDADRGVQIDAYVARLALEGARMIRRLDANESFPSLTPGGLQRVAVYITNAYLLTVLVDARNAPLLLVPVGSFVLHTVYHELSDLPDAARTWGQLGRFPSHLPPWNPGTNPPPDSQL